MKNFLSRRSSGESSAMSRGADVHMIDASEGQAAELTPRSVLAIGWKRKWMIVGCVGLALVGGLFYLKNATPQYTGYAKLYIKKNAPTLISSDGAAVLGNDETLIYTQTALMTSSPVINDAISRMTPSTMLTFAETTDPAGFLKTELIIEVGKRDGILTLSFDSPSRDEAAQVVGAVIDAYRAYQANQNKTSASEVLTVLQREKDKRVAELDVKRKEQTEFLKSHGQISFKTNDKGNIIYQRLAKLSDELTSAQIAALNAKVNLGSSNTPSASRNQVALTQGRADELAKAFEEQQKLALQLNASEAEYNSLTTEVARLERLLDTLDARMKELDLAQDGGGTNISIIEQAAASAGPTNPNRSKALGISVLAGLLLGASLVTLRELTDERLRSSDDIIATLGMPVLGMIPHMNGRQSPAIRGRKVQLEFMSDVAEAYRTLRTSIYFGTRNDPAKTLLVTSPSQGDGKSTTASNLAIAIAQAGRRTLIVDTDFRRPQLHKIFEIKDETGLSSVLAGRETLDKAIHQTGVKGLEILPCGPIPSNPSEILNSDAFAKLLMSLSSRYDMIVLDSPPVSPVTDARILGAICDATLLVLKTDKSTRKNATLSADALHSVGARLLGVVCNGVTRKKGSERYYTGYGYGYPRSGQSRHNGGSGEARRLPVSQMSE